MKRFAVRAEGNLEPRTVEQVELEPRAVEQVEIRTKYAGYIERQQRQIDRNLAMETQTLPDDVDYDAVASLRKEAAGILRERRPATLGQAARLSGVNPTDTTALLVHLRVRKGRH